MSDTAAFLRAIHARPLDPLPRLIYADFLDEQGRPDEAAWLRADVRLWQADDPDPDDLSAAAAPDGVPSLAQAKALAAVPWVAAVLCWSVGQSLAAALRGLLPGR